MMQKLNTALAATKAGYDDGKPSAQPSGMRM
ncbi:hypothetical protein FHT76_000139 [Rhizobium sp. BK176]|nr:hypothetical protein [Rhizobium sp. BK176]